VDGDSEVLRDQLQIQTTSSPGNRETLQMLDSIENHIIDNGAGHSIALGEKTRDAITDVINWSKLHVQMT